MVDLAGDVALEAADDLALGGSFGFASSGVGACAWAEAEAADRGEVEGAVGLSLAAAVEPVALRHAGARGERRDAAEHREAGLAAQPLGVVAGGDEQLAGDLDADPDLLEQSGVELTDELLDRLVQVCDLVVELDDPAGDALEREPGRDDRVCAGVGVWTPAGAVRISCIRVRLRVWSRTSSGAAMIIMRSSCSAERRLLTEVCRATRSTRRASISPSRCFATLIRLPSSAARAATIASSVSSLPRLRRSTLSVPVTSRTGTPASAR